MLRDHSLTARLLLLTSLVILLPGDVSGQSRDPRTLRPNAGETRWYRLSAAHADTSRIRNQLNDEKAQRLKGNELSEITSDDGTQVVMKIPDTASDFREAFAASGAVLQIYDRFNHKDLLDLLYRNANWTNQFPDEP